MSWSDLAKNNPFQAEAKQVDEANVEMADTVSTIKIEQANMTDRYVIRSTDGRDINVIVDNSSRTVYPIREKA
ncbi:hypothetical protein EVB87_262 [Rhizobium phage RHph_N28_1]|nr:hypothetical protein EVB87_262 [Rhizobium phage RHph_N28_1]QIG74291.1 hypothetical protein EVC07_263 [Rhizobium phage RHph_N42]QIG74900.1 hypothetical protein EVC12_265 [Rhizobium phage RHph_I42]QXV73950.1 hypothetical protein [Rhizobium phage RHph_N46]QXV74236.1 hypothetical protein [Rhizobium phage RHEph12]